MAAIGQIRKNSWILIVLIGLGMFGFLVMDMLGQQGSSILGNNTTVGKVGGKKISINDFQRRQNELYSGNAGDANQIRQGLWNYYVKEAIIYKEASNLGLGVSVTELKELQFGADNLLSQIIRNNFGDQRTRQVNRDQLRNIEQRVLSGQMTPDEKIFWANLEDQIILDKLENKINTLVNKSIFTPTWMAEMEHNADNQKVDFRYISVPYATVNDDEVKVTDAELRKYISENSGKYMNEEQTRKLDYISFTVTPTPEDSAEIFKGLEAQIKPFADETNDSLFVANANEGSFDQSYVLEDAITDQIIKDTAFKVEIGTVIGPYQQGSKYKIAKIVDRQPVPDSVKAQHILLGVDQKLQADQNAYIAAVQAAQKLADSLLTELNDNGAIFDTLAARHSTGPSGPKGGDLGTFGPGAMVKPFNDYCFYESKVGESKLVYTEFGIHIVKVNQKYNNGKMGVQIGYLSESIVPSSNTERDVLKKASRFITTVKSLEEFAKKAEEEKLTVETTATGFNRNDFFIAGVGQGDEAREIVKWAFDASKNKVSQDVYEFETTGDAIYTEKFVVVGLKSVSNKGLASVDDVRLEAETFVKNQKKAAIIKKKIDSGSDLESIATAFESTVKTASQVSFNATQVPDMGNEPKVIAAAFNQELNKVSKPIDGEIGVYVIEVTFKPEPTKPTDIPAARRTASSKVNNQVNFRLFESLKGQTTIKDQRYKFF